MKRALLVAAAALSLTACEKITSDWTHTIQEDHLRNRSRVVALNQSRDNNDIVLYAVKEFDGTKNGSIHWGNFGCRIGSEIEIKFDNGPIYKLLCNDAIKFSNVGFITFDGDWVEQIENSSQVVVAQGELSYRFNTKGLKLNR
ncbi:hypothetical protein WEU32_06825 [Brevundimonas sp. BH3]|uniref:hypothetical protein n=1 Tax=Brevundimonas sp. BH3 TaxID=3133089 RepID=UPI00324FF6F2